MDDGQIFSVEEFLSPWRELMVKLGLLGNENESGGIPVQSVDGMKSGRDALHCVISQHCIGKGSRHFPMGGMNELSAGFVHDKEKFIFVAYVKGESFGRDRDRRSSFLGLLLMATEGNDAEGKTKDDSDDGGKGHALERDCANGNAGGRDPDAHHDGGQEKIDGLVVVHLALHENADA